MIAYFYRWMTVSKKKPGSSSIFWLLVFWGKLIFVLKNNNNCFGFMPTQHSKGSMRVLWCKFQCITLFSLFRLNVFKLNMYLFMWGKVTAPLSTCTQTHSNSPSVKLNPNITQTEKMLMPWNGTCHPMIWLLPDRKMACCN